MKNSRRASNNYNDGAAKNYNTDCAKDYNVDRANQSNNNYKVDVAQDYSVDRAKVIKIATKDYVVDKANNYNVDRTTISTGQCKIYFENTWSSCIIATIRRTTLLTSESRLVTEEMQELVGGGWAWQPCWN